jgi:hypothetical protein
MKNNKSYMELCIHIDKDDDVYLRVPTLWDDIQKQWIGFVKTPNTKMLLSASGKDSFELQNNFNHVIHSALHDPISSEEVFLMFKTKEFWENKK